MDIFNEYFLMCNDIYNKYIYFFSYYPFFDYPCFLQSFKYQRNLCERFMKKNDKMHIITLVIKMMGAIKT